MSSNISKINNEVKPNPSPVEKSISLSFSSKFPEEDDGSRLAFNQNQLPNSIIVDRISVNLLISKKNTFVL